MQYNPAPRLVVPAATLAAILGLLWLAACGGGEGPVEQLGASSFLGGSVSNFNGPDGADPFAQDTARAALGGASFDLTPEGFSISSGPVASDSGGDFGLGNGTLSVSGDDASVDLDITSTNPDITNVSAVGRFSLAQAEAALLDPGKSFEVDWTLSFDGPGALPFEISLTQTLSGADFMPVP